MKVLFAILLGVVLGIGAMHMVMKPYETSPGSDVRLYENVIAK